MLFRGGINLGDVMVTEDNLFGDAVNIAARLEAAAQPEGICVSHRDQARNRELQQVLESIEST